MRIIVTNYDYASAGSNHTFVRMNTNIISTPFYNFYEIQQDMVQGYFPPLYL